MDASALPLARASAADWLELTKPRITLLVVFTALVGFVTAAQAPGWSALLVAALAGTALVAAGASALNQVLERATDEYETLRTLLEAAANAERTRDEALAILPAHAAYQMTRPRPIDRDDTAWFGGVDAAASLTEFLDRSPLDRPGSATAVADDLIKRTRKVLDPLDELRQRLLREFETLDVHRIAQRGNLLDHPRRHGDVELVVQIARADVLT